jgi:hypothetical protein
VLAAHRRCGAAGPICRRSHLVWRERLPTTIARARKLAPRCPQAGCQIFLRAVVPVAAVSVGIGPIPAEVGGRTRRHSANCGNRDESAERNAGDDGAVVRPPYPGASKPIRPAAPARGATPRSTPTRASAPPRRKLDWLGLANLPADVGACGVDRSPRFSEWLGQESNSQHCSRDWAFCHVINPPCFVLGCSATGSRQRKSASRR